MTKVCSMPGLAREADVAISCICRCDRRAPSGVHIDLKLDLHIRLRLSTPEELMQLSERDLQVSTLIVSCGSHIHREYSS